MSDWQTIDTAPKDGTVVNLRRIYQGRIVKEGRGLWGHLDDYAPSRSPPGLDPLGRLSAKNYAREAAETKIWADSAKWLNEDRMHAFPTPTHWKPHLGPSPLPW